MGGYRRVSNDALIDDLAEAIFQSGEKTMLAYLTYGKYSTGIYQRRFGSWAKAVAIALERIPLSIGAYAGEVVCLSCETLFPSKDRRFFRVCDHCKSMDSWETSDLCSAEFIEREG